VTAYGVDPERIAAECALLVFRKAALVGATTHARVHKLNVVILPPAELANLIAARRLTEHAEAAAWARKELFRHEMRSNVGDERRLEAHEVCRKPSARLTG
jgi:hypothetical protein